MGVTAHIWDLAHQNTWIYVSDSPESPGGATEAEAMVGFRSPLPSRHMSDRSFAHQKARSDICFGRLIRTICCPAARHMSGSVGLSGGERARAGVPGTDQESASI